MRLPARLLLSFWPSKRRTARTPVEYSMPMRLAFNGCATSHRRMRQELLLWDGFFSRTKHQLEQQFGLPSVGKETLHDVSASATKPASADAKNVDQKTSLFGIPKGA